MQEPCDRVRVQKLLWSPSNITRLCVETFPEHILFPLVPSAGPAVPFVGVAAAVLCQVDFREVAEPRPRPLGPESLLLSCLDLLAPDLPETCTGRSLQATGTRRIFAVNVKWAKKIL